MKPKTGLIGIVVIFVLGAVLAATVARPSGGDSGTVAIAQSKLGRILVDRHGRSLYLFARDKSRMSTCYGACAADWPPLIVSGKPRAAAGAKATLLGRAKRKDGRWQATYNGHPLYRFVKDTRSGQTNGEELSAFGAEWYLVSPAGAKVEEDDAASGGDDSGYGGYGYGG